MNFNTAIRSEENPIGVHLRNLPIDDPDVHDSENILEIERTPRPIVVISSGPAGCEYASVFRRAALVERLWVAEISSRP